jgi:hypothetical protein
MSTVIRLPEKLYKRLEQYAEGFDTPVQVIERILNQLEGTTEDSINTQAESTNLLPIELIPSDVFLFKETLLEKREAKITVFYKDGRKEVKSWKANRFTEESDVIANLRSRKDFRQGEWQKLGIESISVLV